MSEQRLWRIEGDQLRLSLHQPQLEAWDSTARFTAYIAGTQSGKTSFGPWWLAKQVVALGGGDYIAATATYDLFKLKMLPEIRNTFEYVLKVGRFWAGDSIMELCDPVTRQFMAKRSDDPMWGRIILRSAQASGGLESATAKAAWLDEAGQDGFILEAWEAVLRRLALSQGPVLITTTPYNLGWLKTEVYDRWKAGNPNYRVIQAPSDSNPAFPKDEMERARREMAEWKYQMFYLGQFGRPAGMIYGDFDESVHVVEAFPIPREWPRYVGLDFGANNTALVWLAEDVERAAFYIYRESLEGGKSTPEHAMAALEHAKHERVVAWMGGAPSETQQRADWQVAGVPVQGPLVTDVEAGIDRVVGLWRTRRLYVFSSCRGVRDELGRYSRVVNERGEATEQIKDKATFHRLDALRYIAQAITARAAPMPSAQPSLPNRWGMAKTGDRWAIG